MFCPYAAGGKQCPDCEALAAYVDHGLGKRDRTKLERHIASCQKCVGLIAGVIRTFVELKAATYLAH